ncbi:hypothetical protein [Streptomyces sp. SID3343]|uniref:hypothetical protein n=1 Tax=Streptomyces sp. SID3343 TaxID=2690260 RepID=UPI00136BFA2E|nr:hypothetical protein [Streptomyces sp. SID3343]MYV96716.1 hypothetical protein [Streptomyces sp. SID3343]
MSTTAPHPIHTRTHDRDRDRRPRTARSFRRHVPTSLTEVWQRSAYATLALPLALASIVLTLCGRSSRAHRLQCAAAYRFLGVSPLGAEQRPTPAGRVLLHSATSVAPGVPALILVGYAYGNTIRNLTYPIWYGDTDYQQAWGGPTMAGVWSVHAIGGLAFFAVCLCLVKMLTNVQAALARRTL